MDGEGSEAAESEFGWTLKDNNTTLASCMKEETVSAGQALSTCQDQVFLVQDFLLTHLENYIYTQKKA